MSHTIQASNVVHHAVRKLEDYLLGEDTQTFWSETGAVVLTDNEAYEVYTYGSTADGPEVIIQIRDFEQANGWRDVTGNVLR